MASPSNYDKFPVVGVASSAKECSVGWDAISATIRKKLQPGKFVVCVECYPGCFEDEIEAKLAKALQPSLTVCAGKSYKPADKLNRQFERDLGGDDPVFGRMNNCEISDFLDDALAGKARESVDRATGLVLVIGTGASLLAPIPNLLIYADMARWEIQLRQRANEITNLGIENKTERAALKYKRAFFIDWRAADRLKKRLFEKIDFVLDTNDRRTPKMIPRDLMLEGLRRAASQPFRVVPFFDPGPWGGQWMKEVCDLPRESPNYAWCFDCVPEENSLFLGFGGIRVEIPSINVVFQHPRELLGDAVHGRFGTEFPIRFDFLDTMGGGNLSFQVHPLTEYIQEKFGMNYTQDESYYLLDATEEGTVYLGLKEGIDRAN
ncbi:MAG TPA: mannose-6-phosphate isomerase, partial [Terriglobales bacterium]